MQLGLTGRWGTAARAARNDSKYGHKRSELIGAETT